MTRKYLTAGVLAVAGFLTTADRASAQVTIGPAGVSVGTRSGNGVVVPYNQSNGLTLTTPNGAINTQTGTIYTPAYTGRNGQTTYLNPQTGNYYNPVVGDTTVPPYAYQNNSAFAYPRTSYVNPLTGAAQYQPAPAVPYQYAYPVQSGTTYYRPPVVRGTYVR